MLHTLHSLSALQSISNIVLDQQHYTVFDSRKFKSNYSMEDTFKSIEDEFFRVWNNTIKPFIDSLINSQSVFKVDPVKPITLIPEEAIYLKLQGLDRSNITYFYRLKGIRLIGIETDNSKDKDSTLSIFNSPVYDPLEKEYYSSISIILYKKLLSDNKDDKEFLNRILLRVVNLLAINIIDDQLMTKYNVPVNRVLSANSIDANKDIILLPESLNFSDIRFIYSYFFTLFDIMSHVLNEDLVRDFSDYSSIISLPDIFNFDMTDEEAANAENKIESMTDDEANLYALGFKQKLYRRIWDFAIKSDKTSISDDEYIQICADIMRNLAVNVDELYYQSIMDAAEAEMDVADEIAEEEDYENEHEEETDDE